MHFLLMDEVVSKIVGFSAIFLFIAIVSEAFIFFLFKWKSLWHCLLGSLLLNLLSIIIFVGILFVFGNTLTSLVSTIGGDETNLVPLLLWFLIIVFIELPILYLLNKQFSANKVILATFSANILSFSLVYLFIAYS